jgi:hypothetical protein
MRKPGKERRFDRLSLVRRKRRQSRAQQLALLAQLEYVVRIGSPLGQQLPIAAAAALLSVFEAQAIDRARTRRRRNCWSRDFGRGSVGGKSCSAIPATICTSPSRRPPSPPG